MDHAIGIKSSISDSIGNMEDRSVIFQKTLINIIPPIIFHLIRVENDKTSGLAMAMGQGYVISLIT
jgi:hypothetical protein